MTSDRPRSTTESIFRFCPGCGSVLESQQLGQAYRPTCPSCGFIQYRNPVVGVAAVIDQRDVLALLGTEAIQAATGRPPEPEPPRRILLVRRTASFRGLYCIPCGYVEYDEDYREALVREIEEETGLVVEPREIVAVHSNFHDPDRQSVGIWLHVQPTGGSLRPGDDVDRLLFAPVTDPGAPLAFPTDRLVLADLAR